MLTGVFFFLEGRGGGGGGGGLPFEGSDFIPAMVIRIPPGAAGTQLSLFPKISFLRSL